jgi:hypothetical protein
MKDIVSRIYEAVAQIEAIQAEDREMTEAEKAQVQELLLSIAEQRLKELEEGDDE